ncbi:MAG TPA: nucleotidyltransferase family protein [Methylomirabilota bacterium]|nr:nucleotidyltransferase family protein [Methylomirabilota bacterium]
MSRALDGLLAVWPDSLAGFRDRARRVADWDALVAEAGREGVTGVLDQALAEAAIPLPEAARAALARARAFEELWLDTLERALDGTLGALEGAGIRAVALKGPVLAERLYPAARMRFSSDLDLLVRPSDLDRAAAVLSALGYAEETGPSARYHRRHHHHIHLVGPRPPMIELHFRAYAGFGVVVAAEDLMAAALPYRTARGGQTWILTPEDELLYLAIHAAGHCFERLLWLYDLKLFSARHPRLDWTLVASRARRLGVAAAASFAFEAVRRRLDVDVPLTADLQPPRGLRRLIGGGLVAWLATHPDGARATLARVLCMASLCDDRAATARFLHHHLTRMVRRRAQHCFPGLIPLEWSA